MHYIGVYSANVTFRQKGYAAPNVGFFILFCFSCYETDQKVMS